MKKQWQKKITRKEYVRELIMSKKSLSTCDEFIQDPEEKKSKSIAIEIFIAKKKRPHLRFCESENPKRKHIFPSFE
jgi:hypothetical protein